MTERSHTQSSSISLLSLALLVVPATCGRGEPLEKNNRPEGTAPSAQLTPDPHIREYQPQYNQDLIHYPGKVYVHHRTGIVVELKDILPFSNTEFQPAALKEWVYWGRIGSKDRFQLRIRSHDIEIPPGTTSLDGTWNELTCDGDITIRYNDDELHLAYKDGRSLELTPEAGYTTKDENSELRYQVFPEASMVTFLAERKDNGGFLVITMSGKSEPLERYRLFTGDTTGFQEQSIKAIEEILVDGIGARLFVTDQGTWQIPKDLRALESTHRDSAPSALNFRPYRTDGNEGEKVPYTYLAIPFNESTINSLPIDLDHHHLVLPRW